ncbi:hypothetical protein C1645_213353 [Glomus cerebriforme]|uniref:Protein kinase domain-containing protein n=1 Tax=Glomus cerebriforme TaxID=658196 RepID=A0A397T1U4_9GLOM|nr:hypothetical protein C1645_213353 [Glomus cerebriforme]
MTTTNSSNDCINWIEEAISKNYFKYYEHRYFSNVQKVGAGGFGEVFRANWKNSEQYLALKSFFNLDNATAKEIVNEVIIIHSILLSLEFNKVFLIFFFI